VDDFLHTIPLFSGLDESVLRDVRTAASPFAVEAGKDLFRQDDPADGIYLIARGRLSVSERAPGDDVVDLVEVGPGAVLGELSLLDGGRRSATVRVSQDATGFFLSRRRFDALQRNAHPSSFELIDRIRIGVARRARAVAAVIASEPVVIATRLRPAAARNGPPPQAVVSGADSLDGPMSTLRTFTEFTRQERAALISMGQRVDAPRGTILSEIGADPEFLLVVVRGALRASIRRGEQLEQLSIYGPGRMAGMLSLIDGGATHDLIDAREDAIVLRLPRRDFETCRRSYSELAYKLFDQVNIQLAGELRRLSRHLGRLRGIRHFNSHQATTHV
jgi:CRP/FNR family transcriptional regulator, cyclic AMP receptor protein